MFAVVDEAKMESKSISQISVRNRYFISSFGSNGPIISTDIRVFSFMINRTQVPEFVHHLAAKEHVNICPFQCF